MKKFGVLNLSILLALFAATSLAAFGQVDVARRTMAITYPLDDEVDVQFRGTTRFPRMKGSAHVKRSSRSGTKVELSVEKMPRPFELGAGYATYVLWAIGPDGQVDNLGEIKRSGFFVFDSKITVTTPLQTFALIVTAEPHFLVTRPSQAIMLENLNPIAANGKSVLTIPAVQYFGNSSDYFRDPRTPEIAEIDYSKTPSAILQAKQALALARFAGAERDAPAELTEAETLLQNAENSWKAGRDSDIVDIAARRSISAAVKAETTAYTHREARLKRDEKTKADSETRSIENRYQNALNEIASLKEELARETRNRELAERDVLNYANQNKDLKGDNRKLTEDVGRIRSELDTVKADLAASQKENQNLKSTLNAAENEKQNIQDQQRDKMAAIARVRAGEANLVEALKHFGTVTRTSRGWELILPETYWTNGRSSTLAAASDGKLTSLADILMNNPDYNVVIESHIDNSGVPDALQQLTDNRAKVIGNKFVLMGVDESRVSAKGLGASLPVAPNTTPVNKAKNRRVVVILNANIQ